MIRITAKPGNRLDTIATSAVKSALAGAESDVDTPNTSGARSLIRRALADLPHHATALPNGDIAMNNRHSLVIVATWSTCEALIHQGSGCGCGYVAMEEVTETLDLMERSGDKVLLAFDIDGTTKSLEGTFTPAEARVSIDVALDLGATRVSVRRFEI